MKKISERVKCVYEGTYSGKELFFIAGILFLAGVIWGMMISPKGDRMYGCNNGNNSGNCCGEDKDGNCVIRETAPSSTSPRPC